MKTIALYIMSALLICGSVSARVGETEHELVARYGAAIAMPGLDELSNEIRTYSFHGFTISVTFVSGRSEVEFFVKCKDGIPCDKEWAVMTEPEVAAILAAYESTGVKWKPGEGTKRPLWWTSEDGRLKARNMFNQLQIGTVDYVEKRTARINQNKEDRLKGF